MRKEFEIQGCIEVPPEVTEELAAESGMSIDKKEFEKFDAAKYTKQTFGMFTGNIKNVQMEFDNSLVGVVVDRFGTDVMIIPKKDDKFTINVDVSVSSMFYSWVAGFEDKVKILGPQEVVDGMKNMIETLFIVAFTLIGVICVTACSDKLDVQQVYEFDLATLPVQTTIVKGEEAEIRCQLIRSGKYQDTKYFIRYFQPTGKGELRMEDDTVLLPNDLYPLPEETFRLYYKSLDTDQQKIDIYILDSFGQVVQKSFAFNNEAEDEKEDTE